jgi:hypothetical protein
MRGEQVACRGKNFIQDFGTQCEGKRQLGRSKFRWDYNIKMDLAGTG